MQHGMSAVWYQQLLHAQIYVPIDRMWTASPWCPGPKYAFLSSHAVQN